MSSILSAPDNMHGDSVRASSATPGATRHDTSPDDFSSGNTAEISSLDASLTGSIEEASGPSSPRSLPTSPMPCISSPASGSASVRQTAAQKRREKKLRDDPMADVQGPTSIICKRCMSTIKLSPKSTYDPFHWNKHKERCLRRTDAAVERKKLEAKEKSRFPKLQTTSRSVSKGSSPKEITPPLTPDSDEDRSSFDYLKEESPAPELPPPPQRNLDVLNPNPLVKSYLYESHQKIIREMPPLSPEDWKNWSWSRLKRPVWDHSSLYHVLENDGDDDDDDMRDATDPAVSLHRSLSPDYDLEYPPATVS